MAKNIRVLPAQEPRVETGPTQFGDDWPGVFIRGDNAAYFAMHLEHVLTKGPDAFSQAVLYGLLSDLKGCLLAHETPPDA